MGKGGTDGFYLHSEIEAVIWSFNSVQENKHNIQKTYILYNTSEEWREQNQETEKSTKQTSSNSGNKPISLPHPGSVKYFGATCPHQLLFNFQVSLEFPMFDWDQRRLPYHAESHSCNMPEKIFMLQMTLDLLQLQQHCL